MSARSSIALLAISALLVSAQTPAQTDLPIAKAETVGMSTQRLQRVHAFMQDYIDTDQIAAASAAAVPEPGTLGLLAMGAAGLLMPRRWNRRLVCAALKS